MLKYNLQGFLPCVSKRGGMTNSMSSKGIRKATNKNE